jgi:hypothetical protein
MPKTKLLRLVRHLDIYDVPNTYRCKGLLSLAEDKGLPRLLAPTTVSFRPIATWRLMLHSMESERTAFSLPHPVLVYLKVLGIQHLCIQMPILDQQAEDSLAPMRNRNPRNYQDIASIRTRLRDGMLRPGDFYGFLLLQCPNMTIHNLTLLSTNRLFLRLTESTTNVRIFYRPCCGADGEVFDKISDHYCYNHSESAHHITPSLKVLSATQNAQFIDMDWVRGKYDPLRKNKPMELVTDDYSRKGGQKSFKMSSEVEACRCGGKHQLSAVKVSSLHSDVHVPRDCLAGIQSLISYVASK